MLHPQTLYVVSNEPIGGKGTLHAYTPHMLSHRADVEILFLVIIKTCRTEGGRCIAWTLLFVEVVILHIGINITYVHKQIVLLRSIPRIGYDSLGITMVA